MKITCHCGHLIPDQTDSLPHKARLIPDQNWEQLLERIESEVLGRLAAQKIDVEAASITLLTLLSKSTRLMYQCNPCGRLYLNDAQGTLHCYHPNTKVDSLSILKPSIA
ncbi:hypothetical protein [Planctomicrobium sp. SH527]|uniref:hypothetical protein n=1 Tax=Planctomicrobium sp. SH527 TaxID=3448123 RepID=UPI003F5C6056